jgi:myo-inositol-1(or 4)-monophosphatase
MAGEGMTAAGEYQPMPSNEIDLAQRFDFAVALARQAGAVAMHYFRKGGNLQTVEKGPQDLVTIADHEVDWLIRHSIAEHYPDDGILTEESGGMIAQATWVIDPIDGTGNFARGIASFAISIAFSVGGTTEIGIVYDPVADEMFTARRGRGAFCNGAQMHVSATQDIRRAGVEAGYSRKAPLAEYLALLDRLLDAGCEFMQFGSAARGLAQVASGRIDAYVEAHLFAWDVLAGLLLVEEAGGCTSGFPLIDDGQYGLAVYATTPAIETPLRAIIDARGKTKQP